ncbi:MAG TPA: nucleotide disphospho-sugar-binding domain-containing protein [Angustibacter sp.]|nr:nucleotide disphospho-sugar-binding domain-containing protein [Angustibacter sp.]
MATVLAYTSPAIGHLFPLTPLLLELQARGHTVHLRTLAAHVEQMRALGLRVEAIAAPVEAVPLEDFRERGARRALAATARTFARRGHDDGPDLQRALGAVRPDAVIVDVNSWGAAAAAEAWGGPWATFSPYTPALRSPGTPPFGPGLPPLAGPVGRVRDAVVGRLVTSAVEQAMLPAVNELRATLGVATVASVDELLRKAPLMVVTTAKPFEYAATEWGPHVVMVGAQSWEPAVAEPEWLTAVERPIVLVTTSSEFQDDATLVRTALLAFDQEPVHVVATMPAGVPDDLSVPTNATVLPFVPHARVLERACVAVTHGGMGATQKALAHGVPVCVVPFGRDQLEVARRVEVSGAGTRLPRRRLTARGLRTAVYRARDRTQGARRVAAGYRQAGGARSAADAVEQRLLAAVRR